MLRLPGRDRDHSEQCDPSVPTEGTAPEGTAKDRGPDQTSDYVPRTPERERYYRVCTKERVAALNGPAFNTHDLLRYIVLGFWIRVRITTEITS